MYVEVEGTCRQGVGERKGTTIQPTAGRQFDQWEMDFCALGSSGLGGSHLGGVSADIQGADCSRARWFGVVLLWNVPAAC